MKAGVILCPKDFDTDGVKAGEQSGEFEYSVALEDMVEIHIFHPQDVGNIFDHDSAWPVAYRQGDLIKVQSAFDFDYSRPDYILAKRVTIV